MFLVPKLGSPGFFLINYWFCKFGFGRPDPQARSVETLWSILEQIVYAGAWEAKNIHQLKKRIMKKKLTLKLYKACF